MSVPVPPFMVSVPLLPRMKLSKLSPVILSFPAVVLILLAAEGVEFGFGEVGQNW